MAGVLVFATLAEALNDGWQVYDRTDEGYLVRKIIGKSWVLAVVRLAKGES